MRPAKPLALISVEFFECITPVPLTWLHGRLYQGHYITGSIIHLAVAYIVIDWIYLPFCAPKHSVATFCLD